MPKVYSRWVTLVLLFSLVTGLVLPSAAVGAAASGTRPPAPPFWDVVATQYEEPVGALYALGVVSGTSPSSYSPREPVTRAQMAALLVRALGKGDATPFLTGRFTDVPRSNWAYNAVGVAAELGLIQGVGPGLFAPDSQVTYEQAAAMIIRALGYERQLEGGYPAGHVLKAKQLGLLEETRFTMGQPAPRGDVAIMLHAAVFKVPNASSGLTLSQSVFKQAVGLDILPVEQYLTPGAVKLTASGRDWYGKEIPLDVRWTVLGGDAVVDPDGTLTVTGSRSVTVQARAGEMVRTAVYDIINSFTISAPSISVHQGQVVALTATGTLDNGRTTPVNPSWRIVSGPGTVDANGKVTVTGSGVIKVGATIGRMSQEIELASGVQLTVTPGTKLLALGESVQFAANMSDSRGQTINAPITWRVASGDGRVDANGRFTATGSRTAVVEASSGDVKATATVQVISRLDISPKNISVSKAEMQQFSVTAYTGDNQVVPVQASWRTEGGIGVISDSGNFIATGPASGKVVAEYAGLRADTAVTVAGNPVAIQVSLDRQNIVANGSAKVTVTATLVDQNGIKSGGNISTIYFALNNSVLGSLSSASAQVENGQASVTYTPSVQVGTVVLTASTMGGIRAGSTTFTTNAPYLSRIRLEAYPNPLAADGTSTTEIKATLLDQDGEPYKNLSGGGYQVNVTQSGSVAGTLLTNLITVPHGQTTGSVRFKASTAVGSTVISGNAMSPVSPVTVNSTIVGPAAKLHINGDIAPVKANSSDEMAIYVEIQDASGNVRTNDNGTIAYITATNGDYSVNLASTPSVSGIAKIVFRTNKSGTYSLKAYTSNNALQSEAVSVRFLPGAATKLVLSADPTTEIAADNASVIRLVAKVMDANNNLVDTANHEVTFAKSEDKQITRMPDQRTVSAREGVATLEITSTPWTGTETFQATAPGLSESNTITVTSRIVGVPAKVEVYEVTNTPVGGVATVKVRLVDYNGNVVTGANDQSVVLTANSATAVINSPQQVRAGVASFTVTDTKAGTLSLIASSGNLTADTTHAITFSVGQPDHIVLEATPSTLAADGISRTALTANLVDAFGNSLNRSQQVTLVFSNTDVVRTSGNYLYTSGGALYLTAGTQPGSVMITGTNNNGYRVDPLTIQTYIVGAPTRVVVESTTAVPAGTGMASQARIRVRIEDASGNLVTSLNSGSTLTAMGLTVTGNAGDSTTLSITNTYNLGTYGFTPNGRNSGAATVTSGLASFVFTNTRAETVTLTPFVYYNGQRLTPVAGTITTTSGTGAQLRLSPSVNTLSREYQDSTNLHITLSDVYGNTVPGNTSTVSLRLSSDSYLTLGQTTVTLVNGAADVTVRSKAGSVSGSTLISAVHTQTGLTATTTIATDLPPARPHALWAADQGGDDTRITAGDIAVKVSFGVQPRASTQQVLIYVNGVLVPVYSSTELDTVYDTIGANSSGFVGYIRKSDLGGAGVKEIRASLSNPLGMSPMSDPAFVTYAP